MLDFIFSKEKISDKDSNNLVNQIKVNPESIMCTLLKIFKEMFKSLEYGGLHAIWFEEFIHDLINKNKKYI